jgi:hypothetical protein
MISADTLRPVIIAMALQLILYKVARHIPSTGVQHLDAATSLLISNEDNVAGALVIVGIVSLTATLIHEMM